MIDLFIQKYESYYNLLEIDNGCKLHLRAAKSGLIDGYTVSIEILDRTGNRVKLEDYFFYRDGKMSIIKGI